ncbi:MAG: ABC transporter permease [Chloroflexota bacterium]|nr:ABC transporter permease [Chloroflexota bacterium]
MMWRDSVRGLLYVAWKDMRAYYFKPPNISWGMLFPGALILAFTVRAPGDLQALVPGLVAMTALFSATSMEAIVITFERRTGALERLLLAPMTLPAMLAGKVLGGMLFGLTISVVALLGVAIGLGIALWRLPAALLALLFSTAAFSSLGALVSVSVQEVFEAQTLANAIRFPMIFLCGVFVPLEELPGVLPEVARLLPLTYAVEALDRVLSGGSVLAMALDLAALLIFTGALFIAATAILKRRLD